MKMLWNIFKVQTVCSYLRNVMEFPAVLNIYQYYLYWFEFPFLTSALISETKEKTCGITMVKDYFQNKMQTKNAVSWVSLCILDLFQK